MKKTEKIYACIGATDAEDCKARFGLKVSAAAYGNFYINNTDAFYDYYTTSRCFSPVFLHDGSLSASYEESIKVLVKRKIAQRKKLEQIRNTCFINLEAFLLDAFEIDNFSPDDVTFEPVGRCSIAGNTFSFSGTIKDMSCNIEEFHYSTYKSMYELIKSLKKYYDEKSNK